MNQIFQFFVVACEYKKIETFINTKVIIFYFPDENKKLKF